MFTGSFKNKKDTFKFQFKNIYLIILLLIDEQPNKRMFYNEITNKIRAIGSEKTKNEFIRCLVELKFFGILNTNKDLGPQASDLWTWSPGDYIEINTNF